MITQGDIYLADLDPVKGHEQAGYRPVLIFQNDIFNRHLSTVIVVPFSSNMKAQGKFTTYFVPKKNSKLSQDSLLLLFQIKTLDKRRLKKKIGSLQTNEIQAIKTQLYYLL